MPIPVRSIRLQRRSSQSLDTLSGASGEIFFDTDRNTLRLYTANQADSIIMADRTWVLENTFDGDYNSLTNRPSIPSDISQLSDSFSLLFSGDYNDLTNAPDLDALNVDISTIDSIGDVDTTTEPLVNGQLLQWDGEKWQNATVGGFADTTYDLASSSITGGVSLTLTGSDASSDVIEIVGAGDTTVGINLSGQLEINTALSATISGLTDTAVSNPQDGQALVYNSGQWINSSVAGGVTLSSFSASNDTESGNGSLSYDDSTGIFTFTPPDLSTYASLGAFSVTTSTASAGGSLSYNNGTGVFTFRPAAISTFVELTDFSVTTDVASGGGGLSYNNATGVFTFTPSAGGDVVNDTSPELGGALDALGNDILNVGTISATTYSNAGAGAPSITSASTITLDAPDGTIVQNGPFRLPSFTTTDKNSLVAVNGDMVYDSTISQAQVYEGSWTSISGGGGIALTDLSVGAEGTASGDGAIAYNNGTGVFTYTPPDLSSYLTSVPAQSFSSLTGKPTTLAGYGITDAFDGVFSSLTSKPTTLAGYGITDGLSAGATPLLSEVSSTINGATGTVVHNTTTGGVFYHTAPAANFTANFTNVPTTNDRITTVALIIAQGVTQYMPTAVQINNATQTILWQGGSAPTGTSSGTDIVSFTLIRESASWTVIGSATSYS